MYFSLSSIFHLMLWQCSVKGPVRFKHKTDNTDEYCPKPTNLTCPGFVESHDANNLKGIYFAFVFSPIGCCAR